MDIVGKNTKEKVTDDNSHCNWDTWICLLVGNSTELLDIIALNFHLFMISKNVFATTLYRKLYSSWKAGSIQFYRL